MNEELEIMILISWYISGLFLSIKYYTERNDLKVSDIPMILVFSALGFIIALFYIANWCSEIRLSKKVLIKKKSKRQIN